VVSRWRVATITFNWQGPWGADALLTKRSVFPSNYVHNGYTRAVNKDAESLLPLPAATFHILVALTGEDRHGYAILKEVSAQTDGSVKLSAATTASRRWGVPRQWPKHAASHACWCWREPAGWRNEP
jgi:hypothetical protein